MILEMVLIAASHVKLKTQIYLKNYIRKSLLTLLMESLEAFRAKYV